MMLQTRLARTLLALLPAVLLACPTVAGTLKSVATATDPPGLYDPSEPGSIIVYPKFQRGFVDVDARQPGESIQPRSLIELGATCPVTQSPETNEVFTCPPEGLVVRVEFHWVCPPQPDNAGNQFSSAGICLENDFFINLTVNGKVWFSPEGGLTFGDLAGQRVPVAPCGRGFLVGFVVNLGVQTGPNQVVFSSADFPIKFDALIGDAIMRNTPQDLQAFRAVTIQAHPRLYEGDRIFIAQGANGAIGLPLDGLLGDYQEVSGQLSGDVRYASDLTAPFADTAIILLTLDFNSNQTNQPTFVNLNFYNAQQVPFSEALSFTCWGQINITTIDPSLSQENIGSPRGLFITSQAFNSAQLGRTCPDGTPGCVTLLGAVQITEGPIPGPANATRSYTVPVFNNSLPIPTCLLGNGCSNRVR